MIYLEPTKHGMGVELWGTYEDLHIFYEFIGRYWNKEDTLNIKGNNNRDLLISGFSYEVRKAYEKSRLIRKYSHFSFFENEYLGTQISWIHFLFSLSAIKYNMRFRETSKLDVSIIMQIEYWLERAMNQYDEIGAKYLSGFIEDGIYGANEYIYHYMRSINLEYFLLGGGKKAFRKLPDLFKRGVYNTSEYKEYKTFLSVESLRLNCPIDEFDLNDDKIDYENIKW